VARPRKSIELFADPGEVPRRYSPQDGMYLHAPG